MPTYILQMHAILCNLQSTNILLQLKGLLFTVLFEASGSIIASFRRRNHLLSASKDFFRKHVRHETKIRHHSCCCFIRLDDIPSHSCTIRNSSGDRAFFSFTAAQSHIICIIVLDECTDLFTIALSFLARSVENTVQYAIYNLFVSAATCKPLSSLSKWFLVH